MNLVEFSTESQLLLPAANLHHRTALQLCSRALRALSEPLHIYAVQKVAPF